MNGTTSRLFHAGRTDARVVATAARDRQCQMQLLDQVDGVLTPAPVCGEQQAIVDSGNRCLGAVTLQVRGLCLRSQQVTLKKGLKSSLHNSLQQFGEKWHVRHRPKALLITDIERVSGRTRASLNAAGKQKQPAVNDLLNSSEMKGDKRSHMAFTSHVGAESSSHVLFGAKLISLWISSVVTAVQSSSVGAALYGTLLMAVEAVDARTPLTL